MEEGICPCCGEQEGSQGSCKCEFVIDLTQDLLENREPNGPMYEMTTCRTHNRVIDG